jgi:ribonuclease HII
MNRTKEHQMTEINRNNLLKGYDDRLRGDYGPLLCGVDESGRGAWGGPITAAACILPADLEIEGLDDSKKLSERKRRELAELVKQEALAWNVASIWPDEIDQWGVDWANQKAISRRTVGLFVVDQAPKPRLFPIHMIPKADATSLVVAAASVLAKTVRDEIMDRLAKEHPDYGFERTKGYVRPLHVEAVNRFGRIDGVHRFSYRVKGLAYDQG